MDNKYRSRKFMLASIFTITSVIALFAGKMGAGEFIGLAATVLALYGGANVMEKKQ